MKTIMISTIATLVLCISAVFITAQTNDIDEGNSSVGYWAENFPKHNYVYHELDETDSQHHRMGWHQEMILDTLNMKNIMELVHDRDMLAEKIFKAIYKITCLDNRTRNQNCPMLAAAMSEMIRLEDRHYEAYCPFHLMDIFQVAGHDVDLRISMLKMEKYVNGICHPNQGLTKADYKTLQEDFEYWISNGIMNDGGQYAKDQARGYVHDPDPDDFFEWRAEFRQPPATTSH